MPVTPKTLLENRYTKIETIIVVAVGVADMFGRARAQLSDGTTVLCDRPVVGMVAATRRHLARVVPLEHEDGWRVEAWGEEPFTVRAGELAHALGRSTYARRAT